MNALVDWDSPHWGHPGKNVHHGTTVDDGRHDDRTDDQ